MAHEQLAKAILDDYQKKMFSDKMFRDLEIKRFRKLEANLKKMSFEQRANAADVVARGVCGVNYEFTVAFVKSQLEGFMKGTSGKINATSICNLAFAIQQLKPDEKIKTLALAIYKQMCEKYIK